MMGNGSKLFSRSYRYTRKSQSTTSIKAAVLADAGGQVSSGFPRSSIITRHNEYRSEDSSRPSAPSRASLHSLSNSFLVSGFAPSGSLIDTSGRLKACDGVAGGKRTRVTPGCRLASSPTLKGSNVTDLSDRFPNVPSQHSFHFDSPLLLSSTSD